CFLFSSRRRHTRSKRDWSSDVCSSDLVETSVFTDGGAGGEELARDLVELCENDNDFNYLYDLDQGVKEKIETIAKEIYRAKGVEIGRASCRESGGIRRGDGAEEKDQR